VTDKEKRERKEEADTAGAAEDAAALRLEIAGLTDKWLRAAADLENYRKRTARDRERDLWSARAGVALALLEVLDDLERALADDKGDADAFRRGVELIRSKFLSALDSIGVSPFVSVGEPFDPEKHEALARVPATEAEDGRVAAEIRRGYRWGDRVLRHALVAVAEAAHEEKPQVDA
jgi:molecular chaperone GrpE